MHTYLSLRNDESPQKLKRFQNHKIVQTIAMTSLNSEDNFNERGGNRDRQVLITVYGIMQRVRSKQKRKIEGKGGQAFKGNEKRKLEVKLWQKRKKSQTPQQTI